LAYDGSRHDRRTHDSFTGEWWITVVVAGVVINILAAYLKPRLDQIGGWFSRSWTSRTKRRAHERQVRIDRLARDETARWAAAQEEIRSRFQELSALGLMILLCMFLGFVLEYVHTDSPSQLVKLPSWVAIAIAGLAFLALLAEFAAMSAHTSATNLKAELREALDKRDETRTPSAG
jgi:hypothetical protein